MNTQDTLTYYSSVVAKYHPATNYMPARFSYKESNNESAVRRFFSLDYSKERINQHLENLKSLGFDKIEAITETEKETIFLFHK